MVIEKLEHSRVKCVFDVTVDEFKKALDKSFEKNNANVTIKGFRKGKAPRQAFEKAYGVESLYSDALDFVYNEKIKEIFADEELSKNFIGQFIPTIEDEDFKPEEKDFKVALAFDVMPEVKLGQYKDLEIKKANTEVSDEEVNNAIEQLLAPKAEKKLKEEQKIAEGDIVKFDFKGFVNDEAFEGGEATNYELKIGSKQFIPGFEDQMIGMAAGETKDVLVKFPEEYGAKDLAGKDAKFVVTVHEVYTNVLPELNDEFVKTLQINDVETVEALKEFKKNELKTRKENEEKDRQLNEIFELILANATVDMPKTLEDERIEGLREQYMNQAKMYNIPFDTFIGLIGLTKEKFEENITVQGKKQALFNLVITTLISEEKLAPSEEQVKEELAKLGEQASKDKNALARVYSDLAYKAVVEFVLANAKYID